MELGDENVVSITDKEIRWKTDLGKDCIFVTDPKN